MEFDIEGNPIDDQGRRPYLERYIHGAVYETRPDVMSVGPQPFICGYPLWRYRSTTASNLSHGGADRPPYSHLGYPRQIRRHRYAGSQHGPRPRSGGLPRIERRCPDARSRLRGHRADDHRGGTDVDLFAGQCASTNGCIAHGRAGLPQPRRTRTKFAGQQS